MRSRSAAISPSSGVERPNLPIDPVPRKSAFAGREEPEEAREQTGVGLRHHVAEVGDLAHLPEQAHVLGASCEGGDVGIAGQNLERLLIVRVSHSQEPGLGRPVLEALEEGGNRTEGEARIAPVDGSQWFEVVLLDRLHQSRREVAQVGGGAECPVANVAARSARDLADFRGMELPRTDAVVFGERGERHVVEVEVQAHADGVGGDEMIHFARLIQAHLGVAGSGGEGAENERRASRLRAQALCYRVQLREGEHDQGAPPRRALEFVGSDMSKRREPWARQDLRRGHESAQQGPYGVRAEEHRFALAARVDQPLGEDVPAFAVGRKLHFVHGEEVDGDVHVASLRPCTRSSAVGSEECAPRR
jgi:hypothetical protein